VEAVLRREAKVGPLQPTVPREAASGLVLYRMATDARRAMEAEAGRMEEAIHHAFTAEVATDEPGAQLRRERDLVSSPRKARLTAVHMLADLDLPTHWGPAFTVAYTLDKPAPAPSEAKLRRCRVAPRRTPAAWTLQLPDRTRNRLHALATARQERAGIAPDKRTRARV
jgi:hypothetical protein